MATVVEVQQSPARKTSTTLLDLQLRRRERRSRNFLLNFSRKEDEPPSPVSSPDGPPPPAPPPVAKSSAELALELATWMKTMGNIDYLNLSSNDLSGKFVMSSFISKDAPSIEPYPKLENHQYIYKGGRDKDKNFHGKGSIEFDNGCNMTGEWKNGVREGKFKMDADDSSPVCFLEGFYVKGKVQGKVRVQLSSGVYVSGYAKDSALHGFCRYYDADKKLQHIGITRNGKLFGTCWKVFPGGGYIVGRVDAEGGFTGPNIAYIYPDHRRGFLGLFEGGEMVKAQVVRIQGFELEYNSIKVPIFSLPEGPVYKKEISTYTWITENTLLEDPYEKATVFVGNSATEGAADGLFAARDLPANTIAAFYNGLRRQKPADSATTWQDNAYKIFDPTDKKGVIDILEKYQSISNYCASLAHKTNHSFLPNCEFSEIFHPRWGLVPCLVTRQEVKSGEELLVWYGYDLDYCPDWYKDAWENSCLNIDGDKLQSG